MPNIEKRMKNNTLFLLLFSFTFFGPPEGVKSKIPTQSNNTKSYYMMVLAKMKQQIFGKFGLSAQLVL